LKGKELLDTIENHQNTGWPDNMFLWKSKLSILVDAE